MSIYTPVKFFFLLTQQFFKIDFANTQIIVTEPIFNFSYTQECLEELIFEEYGFDGMIRTNG